MDKLIVLMLFALGMQVNAEDNLVGILADRASSKDIESADLAADLDDATLAKASGGAKPAKKTVAAPKKSKGPPGGKFTAFNTGPKGPTKLFGGTNKLMVKGRITEGAAAVPSYWGGNAGKQGETGYGWSLGLKPKTAAKAAPAPAPRPDFKPKGKFTAFNTGPTGPKKLFGGTNKNMVKGKITEGQAAVPAYWGGTAGKQGEMGYGWSLGLRGKTKAKAQAGVPLAPPLAPVAPRFGGARPLANGMGFRPFALDEMPQENTFGDIAFFVGAMSLISLAVFLSRRGSSARDQESYTSVA